METTYYPSASQTVTPSEEAPAAPPVPAHTAGVVRDENGRFAKGTIRIGGSGRPKGVAAFARSIREQIGYDALRNYAECIWRGWEWDGDTGEVVIDPDTGMPKRAIPPPADADRRWAWQQLVDRGWGKPVTTIDVHGMLGVEANEPRDDDPLANVDVDELPEDMLAQLEAVVSFRLGTKPRSAAPAIAREAPLVIDVPHEERAPEEPEPVEESEPAPSRDNPHVPSPSEMPPAGRMPSAPEATPAAPPRERYTFKGSTNVEGYAYDAASSIVTVRFVGGAVYQYANVTPELLAEWRMALSAGKWLNARLKAKPDLFPCRSVPASEWERP